MIIKTGNMFTNYNQKDEYLITTNSILNNKGCLIMGAGAALEAKQKFKGIDKLFGKYIQIHGGSGCLYGCIPKLFRNFGMFQTKYHFCELSPIELIEFSTEMLKEYSEKWADQIYHLNFPGINYGGLKEDQVLPIIKILPDNINVWKLI
jgi:hypothetical protein